MRGFASSESRVAATAASAAKPTKSLNSKPSKSLNSSGKPTNPLNQRYISQVIERKDWFFILNQEFTTHRIGLNTRFVISILQNQDNPLHSLRFYLWVSNFDLVYAKDQSLKSVLGPLLLSMEFPKEIRESGYQISDELMCVLIGSWGRLGLAKYCNDVFAQISFLGMKPSTRLYNVVIDASVKSNSLDLAYLKFQ